MRGQHQGDVMHAACNLPHMQCAGRTTTSAATIGLASADGHGHSSTCCNRHTACRWLWPLLCCDEPASQWQHSNPSSKLAGRSAARTIAIAQVCRAGAVVIAHGLAAEAQDVDGRVGGHGWTCRRAMDNGRWWSQWPHSQALTRITPGYDSPHTAGIVIAGQVHCTVHCSSLATSGTAPIRQHHKHVLEPACAMLHHTAHGHTLPPEQRNPAT